MRLTIPLLAVTLLGAISQPAMAQLQTAAEAAKSGVVGAPTQPSTTRVPGVRTAPQQSQALNFYTDRPTFQAANPGLPLETYQNGNIGNGGVSGCLSPIDEFSNDACWSPGDILPGISLEFIDNGGDPNDPLRMAILWNIAGIDCAGVGANYFVDYNRYNFNPPVKGAGMHLETFADVNLPIDIEVFDGTGVSLGMTQLTPGAAGLFFGVDTDDPDGIGFIEFIDLTNGGLFFCDVEFGGGGSGTSYCTAKSGLVCGVPSIAGSGFPSASATSGFDVLAQPARGQRSGLLLYGCSGRAAIPFQGGLLCINPAPLRRLPPGDSGGTNGGCDGVFTVDMNTFASGNGGGNPDPCLVLIGQVVNAQWWGRDSVATGSFLSDGLEYTVQP